MGLLFSRKKKLTNKEILEALDDDIRHLTERRQHNMYQEKSFIGYLLVLSFISYLIGAIVFYVYYRPHGWLEYGLYSIPLVLFPIIIYLVKKLLNMYFAHKKALYDQELSNLQAEKRRVLNVVADSETYNVARELLQRFDPQHPLLQETRERRGQGVNQQRRNGGGELRQRRQVQTPHPALLHTRTPPPSQPSHPPTLPSSQLALNPPSTPSDTAQPAPQQTPHVPQQAPPAPLQTPHILQRPPQPPQQVPLAPQIPPQHAVQYIPPGMSLGPVPGPPTPSPILPRERSSLDKMVEYLVGDGPNNRYALICSSCHSHNGMALGDEFEYISFRCAYCFTLNPARREKPVLRRTLTSENLPGDHSAAVTRETMATGSVSMATTDLGDRDGTSDGEQNNNDGPTVALDTEPVEVEDQTANPLDVD